MNSMKGGNAARIRRIVTAALILCAAASILLAQPTISITSPANRTVFRPGETVIVTVTATPSEAFQEVRVIQDLPLGFSEPRTTPPYQFTITIPNKIRPGLYTLTAEGVVSPTQELTSSVEIDVERSDSPISTAVEPSLLTNYQPGDRAPLHVTGTYADGSTEDLTVSTTTTYVSQSPSIASVNAEGVVEAISPGSTTIVINGSLSVPVTVDPPISLRPTEATLNASQKRQFTALVSISGGTAVTWSLNPSIGAIDSDGWYTAPDSIPSQQTVTVTATSVADTTKTASATITLSPEASILITPGWKVLYPAQTQQFSAITSNVGTAGVSWSINPSTAGTISGAGLYTAPATIASTQGITLTATSVANPTYSTSQTIYISPQPYGIVLQKPAITLGQGTSNGLDVTLLAVEGFAHEVAFSVTGLPDGVTAVFKPEILSGGSRATALTLTASTSVVQGSYTVTVVGRDVDYPALTQSKTLTLIVEGGYALSVSSPTVTTVPGGSVAVLVTESPIGSFNSPVLLSAGSVPGITVMFPATQQMVQQLATPGSTALLLKVAASTAPGTYPVTITGRVPVLGQTVSLEMSLVVEALTGPAILAMTPNPGTQTTQILTFTFTHPAGASNISSAGVLVNASQSTASACYVSYSASAQTVSLRNDADTDWVGTAAIGAVGTLSNSQCILDTRATQVSAAGNNVTLTLVLTPVNPVIGSKNVYAMATAGPATSGWNQAGVWTISSSSLPSPWRDQDIGDAASQRPGASTYVPATGTIHMYGSGDSVNTAPDALHYTYQPLSGNGTILARLSNIDNAFQSTSAGVMIRASVDVNSAYVYLSLQSNGGGCTIKSRATAGGASNSAACSTSPAAPVWLKLTRQGSNFLPQTSPDGTTWTDAGAPVTVSMADNVFVGFAVTSGAYRNISFADFDNASVTIIPDVPTFNPPGGTYSAAQSVTLATATPGATVRYTTDGSAPSATVGTVYTGPITVVATTTVRAIAYIGTSTSPVSEATYTMVVPDLTISKTHIGNFTQGQVGATYTITVTNAGTAPTSGTVTVTDTLPTGLALTSISGNGWTCTGLSCTRADGLAAGTSFPAITLTVSVAANAAASATNSAVVSGGGDVNPNNNSAADPTTVLAPVVRRVTVRASGGDYTTLAAAITGEEKDLIGLNRQLDIEVYGTPGGATISGFTTDSAHFVRIYTPPSERTTGKWDSTKCNLEASSGDVLKISDKFVTIEGLQILSNVNPFGSRVSAVVVDSAADGAVINISKCILRGGAQGLVIRPTGTATVNVWNSLVYGNSGNAVWNNASGAALNLYSSTVIGGPNGYGVHRSNGSAIVKNCYARASTGQAYAGVSTLVTSASSDDTGSPGLRGVPYDATNFLNVTAGSEDFHLMANSALRLAGTDTSGDSAPLNFTDDLEGNVRASGTAWDIGAIQAPAVADLSITKTHTGSFVRGQTGATYTITVSNAGTASTSGTVTVTDTLPTGLTATGMSGSGWTCTGLTCARSDALATGSSYPPITLTVNVAADAPASVTNSVTVGGGGDVNSNNNTATDTATVTNP